MPIQAVRNFSRRTNVVDKHQMKLKLQGTGLRQFLRERTHESHVSLNHHPLLSGITKPGYRREEYCLVLAAYFHFYRSVECAIDTFLVSNDTTFCYGERRKLPWLEADLRFFSLNADTPALSPSTPIPPLEIRNLAELVGVLYTIEGATLGGMVISGHIANTLALTSSYGARFFHAYGEDTPAYWLRFLEFSETTCLSLIDKQTAGGAAASMFSQIEGLLDDYSFRINA